MDLAAAVKQLIDLAAAKEQAAQRAATQIETHDIDERHPNHYLLRVGAEITERETPVPDFACQLDHIEDLIDLARHGERGEMPPAGTVTIWHNPAAIVVRRADFPRSAYAHLFLHQSRAAQIVDSLAKAGSFTQKQFIALVRSDLPNVIEGAASLVDAIRQLKFTSASEASGTVQLGKESMGRSIENEVTGAGVIPEFVTMRLPLYDNSAPVDSTITVTADVEIDLAEQRLSLRPVAAQLISEGQRVAADLHKWLSKEANAGDDEQTIAVYRGRVEFES
ncbi:MAG: hypothetical protein K2Y37_14690 [Pirellulales bacterium]|nr:hypothetical protein [Pirellulales bacterium]